MCVDKLRMCLWPRSTMRSMTMNPCNFEDCTDEAQLAFYGQGAGGAIVTPVWLRCSAHQLQPLPTIPDGAILVTTSPRAVTPAR